MHLRDSPSDSQFREELRAWLSRAVPALPPPPPASDWPARRIYDARWQRQLFDAGYAGIDWPKEHGGRGASATEHLIYLEESAAAHAPDVGVNFVGQMHAGPTLIAEASPEQQDKHLPAILQGDAVWCQGFSEPEAGSDLASLRTRAVRDGDEYVISGQKIWTSRGEVADYCELLARTDPEAPKHKGITWLIMPMDRPGIDVRPLRSIHGTTEFAEMFLDEVRVPVANRVGAENDGWRVAMVTFSFERGTAFVSDLLETMNLVTDLAGLARRVAKPPATAWDDPGIRRDIGIVAAELDGLWALTKRNVSRGERGPLLPTAGSAFKLSYAEALHHLADITMRVLDRAGLALQDLPGLTNGRQVHQTLHAFAISIAAGTSQIQRNILAERALGLPKER